MKLVLTYSVSILVCAAAYRIAHTHGIPKFEMQGLVLVLTGGYLFDALFEFLFTFLPLFLLHSWLLLKNDRGIPLSRFLAYFFLAHTLYLTVAQFADLSFLEKGLPYFNFPLFSITGELLLPVGWQAIVPSVGSAFLAAFFALLAHRNPPHGTVSRWVLAFAMTLPVWMGWLIPLSLVVNHIAWSHLPMSD